MLPGEGQVAFSFYNGLSDTCGSPVFSGTYRITGTEKDEPFSIDFSKFTKYEDDETRERKYVVNAEWPNAKYTFSKTNITCGDKTVEFAEQSFGPFAEPVIEINRLRLKIDWPKVEWPKVIWSFDPLLPYSNQTSERSIVRKPKLT